MSPRTRVKAGHNPEHHPCGNPACQRTSPLALTLYRMDPPEGTPESLIHHEQITAYPGFSLMCIGCGHFTVVSPHPPWVPSI